MAIIGIGRNGVGLGHQSRVIALLDALYDRGERPVLLLQGQSCGVARTCYPTAPCPYIWQLTESQREDWRRTVEGYAQLSDPAVIIEDTHPIGISFSSSVRKVLLLRPVEFSAMMGLIQNNRAQFSDYVVADAPGSPTWPYAADETSSIMASNRVSIAGPIYRRPGAADDADVRHNTIFDRVTTFVYFRWAEVAIMKVAMMQRYSSLGPRWQRMPFRRMILTLG